MGTRQKTAIGFILKKYLLEPYDLLQGGQVVPCFLHSCHLGFSFHFHLQFFFLVWGGGCFVCLSLTLNHIFLGLRFSLLFVSSHVCRSPSLALWLPVNIARGSRASWEGLSQSRQVPRECGFSLGPRVHLPGLRWNLRLCADSWRPSDPVSKERHLLGSLSGSM